VTSKMYSAFRVRLLSQVQALPSLVLSRPFSHAGVYVHFLRFIWLESLPRLINDFSHVLCPSFPLLKNPLCILIMTRYFPVMLGRVPRLELHTMFFDWNKLQIWV